ncbi:hypothetical protein BH20ACT19_BH20ACT19_07850 [soil metagenome]
MPVTPVFRCQFCGARPEPETQRALEQQMQDAYFGQYVDIGPARWLVWHGRGPLGPMRYACGDHRGELTAYLRFHYGSVGYHPWKMGPYPRPLPCRGNASVAKISRSGGSGFAAG